MTVILSYEMLASQKSVFLLAMLMNCYLTIIRSTMICSLDFAREVLENAEKSSVKISQGADCGEFIIKEGNVHNEYNCLESCFMIQNCYAVFYDPSSRWCISYKESVNLQSCFSDLPDPSPHSSYYAIFPRQEFRNKVSKNYARGGGALHIFWVRGRAIGKGIYFQDIGIKNSINFHNFGIRNGTDLQDFALKYKVGYTFSQNWYKFGYTFSKNWYTERVCFRSFNGRSPTKIWSSAPPGELCFSSACKCL